MRFLVCGDRNWTNEARTIEILAAVLRWDDAVIHGGCRGADRIGGRVAESLAIPFNEFRADWGRYRQGAGPIRNQRMLDDAKPDVVVAFHGDLESSRGTRDMVEKARKADKPVLLVTSTRISVEYKPPDGPGAAALEEVLRRLGDGGLAVV